MGFGLKLFWIVLLIIVLGGLIYLSLFGIPSPNVDVRHKIELTDRFK